MFAPFDKCKKCRDARESVRLREKYNARMVFYT